MNFNATIANMNAKVDHSGNVIERIVLEVEQGTIGKLGPAMRQPLLVELKAQQLTIGEER